MATNKQLPLPQPVKTVVVKSQDETRRLIRFEGAPRLADVIRQQGMGSVLQNPRTGVYSFRVAVHYDFGEVLNWLERLDPEDDDEESGLPEEDKCDA